MRTLNERTGLRRGLALLLCLSMFASLVGTLRPRAALADAVGYAVAGATNTTTREADPDTTDSYLNRLLTDESGSRYAGRVWEDKSVFAYDASAADGGVAGNLLKLDMETDGYTGSVGFDADFLHVFSALASSQVVNEYPPSPIDMVLVLDISSSMSDVVTPAADTEYAKNADVMEAASFEYTRLLNLVESANNIIDGLMTQNPENRVSVVVYDRRAEVVMPLAHYTKNSKTLKELGEEAYSNDFYDMKYMDPETGTGGTGQKQFGALIEDWVYEYLCPYFDADGDSDIVKDVECFTPVATPREADVQLKRVSWNADAEDNIQRLAGTNTNAGITAGLMQLADAADTTLTAKLSDGSTSTVPRIPALIVMTDGGSNTVADGQWYNPDYDEPVQRSDHLNEWSSVVVTQSLLSAAYLKAAVEKNYEAYMALSDAQDLLVYTVGVDLRDGGDEWVPARLYPMMNPGEYFKEEALLPTDVPNPSVDGGILKLKDEDKELIGAAYLAWAEWANHANLDVTRSFPVVDSSFQGRFQQNEKDKYTNYNQYIIPFQTDDTKDAWHGVVGWTTHSDTDPSFDRAINGTATWESFEKLAAAAQSPDAEGGVRYAAARQVTYTDSSEAGLSDTKMRAVQAVTKQDVVDNINYVTHFYNVTSAEMDSIFEEILTLIVGKVFVPISGTNEAGVGNALTYQDPIGLYMELKNGSVHATVEVGNGTKREGEYDMAMLLFGEMHGLVRTAVYDYQFNDAYMRKNYPSEAGVAPLIEGWYDGDDPETAKWVAGSNALPAGCATAEEAWEKGYVYRISYSTCTQYVPILSSVASPGDLSPQQQHTVYTIYRFYDTTAARNQLRRNPIFGEGVPEELQKIWDAASDAQKVDDRLYRNYDGVYRLSDIRVWHENTGDFIDSEGHITPDTTFDDSLYVNLPAAAIPAQLATITLGQKGVLSYATNLRKDHAGESAAALDAYSAQSTPVRLFYAVGLAERLLIRDDAGNQTGVDLTTVSDEFIASHTITSSTTNPELNGRLYFLSNHYSQTMWDYDSNDDEAGYPRGDPTISLSPSADNRYYVFQKPLPLYKHAYRVTSLPTDREADEKNTGLTAVDNINTWSGDQVYLSNSETDWETVEVDGKLQQQQPNTWVGGVYMGTYNGPADYKQKYWEMVDARVDYITDSRNVQYPFAKDGIIFFDQSLLTAANVDGTEGGPAGTTAGINGNDYYFLIAEYYVPDPTQKGHDETGKVVDGTMAGKAVKLVATRRGSEFGSGYEESSGIATGDMLCWTDLNLKTSLVFDYQPDDRLRGVPTKARLTADGASALKEALRSDYAGASEAALDEAVTYWQGVQAQLLPLVDSDKNGKISDTEYDNAGFKWVLAARAGGLRMGNLNRARQQKSVNTTESAGSYFTPIVASGSGLGNSAIINVYLGNNGRLTLENAQLYVTKQVEAEGLDAATQARVEATRFNYQLYINGFTGERQATLLRYNHLANGGQGGWQRQIKYIDILLDNSGLAVLPDNTLAVYDKNGNLLSAEEAAERPSNQLYYLYLGANDDVHTQGSRHQLFLNNEDGDALKASDPVDAGRTVYMPAGQVPASHTETGKFWTTYQAADAEHPAGSIDFYLKHGWLIPKDEVDEANGMSSIAAPVMMVSLLSISLEEASGWAWNADKADAGDYIYIGYGDGSLKDPDTGEIDESTVKYDASKHGILFATEKVDSASNETNYTIESNYNLETVGLTKEITFGEITASKLFKSTPYWLNEITCVCENDETKRDAVRSTPEYAAAAALAASQHTSVRWLTPAQAAANTAEFELGDGEGLLFSGMDAGIYYNVTEEGREPEGFLLKEANHSQQRGNVVTERKYLIDDGNSVQGALVAGAARATASTRFTRTANGTRLYSVFGNTGAQETGVHYINEYRPATLAIVKVLSAQEGVTLTAEDDLKEFDFHLRLTDDKDAVLNGPFSYRVTRTNAQGETETLRSGTMLPTGGTAETGDLVAVEAGLWAFSLKGGETMTVSDLPANTTYHYIASEDPSDGYVADRTEIRGTVNPTPGTGVLPAETVTFSNLKIAYTTGSLEVQKLVSGAAGDTNAAFHFRVDVGEAINGRYGEMDFENGVALFTLRHGETITATDLPADMTYTVSETEENRDGYVTTVTGRTGTIPVHDTVTAVFTNHRDPAPGNLSVSKTVTGVSGERTREFHFRVELSQAVNGTYGDMTFTEGVAAVTLKHNETKTATGLPYGITYTVTELEANKDGYKTTETNANGTVPAGETANVGFINDRNTTTPPPNIPQTGDRTPLGPLTVVALLSLGALGALLIGGRRRKRS